MGKTLGYAAILALLGIVAYNVATGSAAPTDGGEGEGGGEVPPDAATLEAEACAFVTGELLKGLGIAPTPNPVLVTSLAWIAYRKAYPGSSPIPTSVEEKAALKRLTDCITTKLTPVLPPPPGPQDITPTETPQKGKYYQVKAGDTLFGIASAAYGTQSGTPANLAAAQYINKHDYNHRFWAYEDNLFPPGNIRIGLLPMWGTFKQQQADAAHGARMLGTNYEVIFIPE